MLVLDQARGVWGAQRYLLRLAPLLRERGVELTLAGPECLELHKVWQDAGFTAVQLDLPIVRSIRSSGRPSLAGIARESRSAVSAVRQIADTLRDGNYDAVWANAHWIHLEASIAGRIAGRPVVLHLHEEALPGLGRLLRSGAVRMASRTVAVSQGVAAGLPQIVQGRICVIPNGIDTVALSPARESDAAGVQRVRALFGIGPDDVMVLAAARIDPSKRIEDLVAIVGRLDDSRIRLVIAGSTSGYPEYEREVRAAADRLPGGRIVFCGMRDDMTDLLQASDVVIHAGTMEGMPLGLLEAQSCGKPVVAYAVAGVPEAVRDKETGLLVAACDIAGLGRSLRTLACDASLRATMGNAARAHMLANHRIDIQAARNVAVLQEVCGRDAVVAR